MKTNTMIKNLRSKFDLNAVDSAEFNGRSGGIWIRGDICCEATGYYGSSNDTLDDDNVLNKYLSKHGFFAESYDSETIMIYNI